MMILALKMLMGDRLKYLALLAGVTFAALLITQQASIFTGYTLRTAAWLQETASFDLWVMDPQVEMSDGGIAMSSIELQRVRSVDGVAWAVPMYKDYLSVRLQDGTKKTTRVVGIDDASLVGAPPRIIEGKLADLRQDKGVLISQADANGELAVNGRPLTVGDRFSINDHEAFVVGIYDKSPEFFWEPVIYTTYSRALSWAPPERNQLTYVLATASDGQDVQLLADRIQAGTGLKAMTNDQFISQTAWYVITKTGILINFGITIALGFVVGLLAAGQTFYTFVLDNLKHFAALKAMGTPTRTLLAMMTVQVLVVASLGFGIGVGLAAITGSFFEAGGLAFKMVWPIPVIGFFSVLLCCLIAGGLSMIRVLRLEAGVVFK